jgi:hypothetical protein
MIIVRRPLLAPIAVSAVLLLTACGAASAAPPVTSAADLGAPVGSSSPPSPAPRPTITPAPVVVPRPVAPPTLTPPSGLTWRTVPGSAAVRLAGVDGGAVTLMWLDRTRLRFHYVPGYSIPGGPASPLDTASSTWVPRMVAAFNGGFKISDGAGGYYYRGRTVASLLKGRAAFVIAKDGSIRVGVWGRDLHMSSSVLLVRENLRPLVDRGISVATPYDDAARWGLANGGLSTANRSALGMRADGSLVFAYGHQVTAYAMARNLVRAGVREALALDMNVTWPTGFVYAHHGARITGQRINPAVMRPPSTYYARFTKDFVAVLAR